MKNKHKKPFRPHTKRPAHTPQAHIQKPLLYGFHAVSEAWLNPQRKVQALYVLENAAQGFEPVFKQAMQRGLKRPAPSVLEKHVFEKLLPRDAVHQGIALACAPLPEVGLTDLLIKTQAMDHSVFLILDQITDPHNVGAIIRSASAFGAQGLIMQSKHAPALEGVLAKTASGAVDHLPIAYETNLSRCIEELKENNYFVYGLDERGEDLRNIKPTGKIALVLGAEGSGLRRLIKEHCDALLRLPTSGEIQSLNVSNAAAVALYAFSKN